MCTIPTHPECSSCYRSLYDGAATSQNEGGGQAERAIGKGARCKLSSVDVLQQDGVVTYEGSRLRSLDHRFVYDR